MPLPPNHDFNVLKAAIAKWFFVTASNTGKPRAALIHLISELVKILDQLPDDCP